MLACPHMLTLLMQDTQAHATGPYCSPAAAAAAASPIGTAPCCLPASAASTASGVGARAPGGRAIRYISTPDWPCPPSSYDSTSLQQMCGVGGAWVAVHKGAVQRQRGRGSGMRARRGRRAAGASHLASAGAQPDATTATVASKQGAPEAVAQVEAAVGRAAGLQIQRAPLLSSSSGVGWAVPGWDVEAAARAGPRASTDCAAAQAWA